MKKLTLLRAISLCIVLAFLPHPVAAEEQPGDMTEEMKRSLVYLEISAYGYEQYQPWKHTAVSEKSGYACAVGEYQVLTTAWNVRNSSFIKARRYARNEFIPAKIKVIDYESNLCLIELDPNETGPLKPLKFNEVYRKGAEVDFYYLSSAGLLHSGRGFLDRAQVRKSTVSYCRFLNYIAANTSQQTSRGQIYCVGSEPIGIACWANKDSKEAGLIPAVVINRFLADTADGRYAGFGAVGFKVSELLDPTTRRFLKMPASVEEGVYVSDVYNLGTGSDVLGKQDVILAIDGKDLNPYGRFKHPMYERLSFEHLITSKSAGDTVLFDLWRAGEKIQLQAEVKNFEASEMLVPYYELDRQPQYIITGGFILQKLTRQYLAARGGEWGGKASPHLYHYYRDLAFKPAEQRRDIVILSYVLPAAINLGYKDLGQIVVKKFNGMSITSIADIATARELNPESKYDTIEFELDNPIVVIPRRQLSEADELIAKSYGIRKLANIGR